MEHTTRQDMPDTGVYPFLRLIANPAKHGLIQLNQKQGTSNHKNAALVHGTIPQKKVALLSPLRSRGEGSRSETGGWYPAAKAPPASFRSASPLFHRGEWFHLQQSLCLGDSGADPRSRRRILLNHELLIYATASSNLCEYYPPTFALSGKVALHVFCAYLIEFCTKLSHEDKLVY